jgi:membrane protein DedA with SNARE-associated domain
MPFPSRILLLIAATVAIDAPRIAMLVAASAAGSLMGDHVPYLAGALAGPVSWRSTAGAK